jgi:hypothetical protein
MYAYEDGFALSHALSAYDGQTFGLKRETRGEKEKEYDENGSWIWICGGLAPNHLAFFLTMFLQCPTSLRLGRLMNPILWVWTLDPMLVLRSMRPVLLLCYELGVLYMRWTAAPKSIWNRRVMIVVIAAIDALLDAWVILARHQESG